MSFLASAIGAVDGNTLLTCIVCWGRKCQGVNEILRSVKHQEDEILSVNVENGKIRQDLQKDGEGQIGLLPTGSRKSRELLLTE